MTKQSNKKKVYGVYAVKMYIHMPGSRQFMLFNSSCEYHMATILCIHTYPTGDIFFQYLLTLAPN